MKSVYIFDFDYTLGDSTDGIVACVNFALEKMEIKKYCRDEIKKTIGLPLKETFCTLTGITDEKKSDMFAKLFKEKADMVMVDNSVLYPGVKELLNSLKQNGNKIAIVTTKYRHRIVDIFSKFDALDMLDLIVGGDDVKVEKPNPEGLLWAIEKLNVNAKEVLYVGDSLVDAKTAERGQVDFCAVLTGTTTKEEFEKYPYILILNRVTELAQIMLDNLIKRC